MFNSSYQHISFRQQIISPSQTYPCPRCSGGMLEAFGLTETLKCSCCDRSFVALRGGRLLYPANSLGMKVALTFWWDGLRWHWAGHTASTRQLLTLVTFFFLPIMAAQVAFALNLWPERPEWLSPAAACATVFVLTFSTISFFCWDFDKVTKRKRREKSPALPDRPASN
ncbi:MAG: hypothetical protein JSS86_17300 [Cyanobacteria bacterium SZAS LIN-2]|nr:hypothetical protein [Cyanobacteria bacterium SZAS LIN-2]MBS2008840.1 hypothetical protein [Cyanobacteria bacterium SZAS TMP-1]